MIPAEYDYKNAITSYFNPSTMHVQDTMIAWFFKKYYLQKAMSTLKFTLPDTWAENYFLYTLFCNGVVAVVNTDLFGIIPQNCTFYGYTVQYQPSRVLISNPLLRSPIDLVIGKTTEIIYFQPNYSGILDLVDLYASLSALAVEGMSVNLFNSKLAYVFFAGNKNVSETFKKMYDKIASGEPIVVTDKEMLREDGSKNWDVFASDLQKNFITPDIMQVLADIENMFDTEIGIPAANTEKRERMISAEIEVGSVETYSRLDMWLETLKKQLEKVNKMFGLSLKVEYRFSPQLTGMKQEGINQNGLSSNTNVNTNSV